MKRVTFSEQDPNYIQRCILYFAVNTLRLSCKKCEFVLYGEIVTVCSEILTKHISAFYGHNVEFLRLKPVGTRNKHLILHG